MVASGSAVCRTDRGVTPVIADVVKTATTKYGIFSYWPNDGIGSNIAGGGFWEPHLQPAFDAVPADSVVVDVGANLGWWTIYAARRGCYVYAFEPCPEVFALLKKNVEYNGLSGSVSLFPLALYARCEPMTLVEQEPGNIAGQAFIDGHLDCSQCANSGSMALQPGTGKLCNQYAVPLDFFRIRNVSLIKIDAEGSDLEVLMGAEDTIRTCQPVLCYEYIASPEAAVSRLNAFEEFLRGLDYVSEQAYTSMAGCHRDFIARPKCCIGGRTQTESRIS